MKDINATVIVDISPSEEEILNNLQKDARWGIKRAQKEGLQVIESDDWETFYKIYEDELSSIGVRVETLEHIKEHSDVLFLCKKEDKVIAGAVLEIINNIPKLTRAASIPEYRKFQPNNLLYWHCILWSKKRGHTELDLGGWQINARGQMEGVNKFKERWGEVKYFYKDYPFHVAIGRKLVRKSPLVAKISRKLKIYNVKRKKRNNL